MSTPSPGPLPSAIRPCVWDFCFCGVASPAEQSQERIYTRPPHFSVHLRAGRRLRWAGGARTDYTALFLLGGRLRWRASAPNPEAGDETSPPAPGSPSFFATGPAPSISRRSQARA